jgi:succinyl-CoA synthetase beta subunit
MKLFEYQAKEAFAAAGIPVPASRLVTDPAQARAAAAEIGLPCVIKAQVLTGGRGKAGLIKLAKSPDEVTDIAARLLGDKSRVITRLLVEQAVDFVREVYLSITVDPPSGKVVIMACAEGGVDIEQLAATAPEKISRTLVDIDQGLQAFQIKNVVFALGLAGGETGKQAAAVVRNLYGVFRKLDAELTEINPLFVTADGQVVAGDGKLSIDDNSLSRQPGYELSREYFDSDTEFEAAKDGIPYLQFDGDISLMCAGAGLTTTVFDLINYEGGSVANYLEFGGPNYRRAKEAMELCLKNDCKVLLIVTFGTIARADVMAEGVVAAMQALKPRVPIVTCIRGTNEEEATATLRAAGLTPLFDTEEAVRKAVALAAGGKS